MAFPGPGGPVDDRAARIELLAAQLAAVGAGTEAGRPSPRSVEPASTADAAAKARNICLRLLTGAPRSRASLAEALRRKEIPDDVAGSVLDRLEQVGLINDEAYAQLYVAAKHRDRGLGRSALRTELRRKGVPEEAAAEALASIDAEAESERAYALVEKRVGSAMAAGPIAARRRLMALLARRGYGSSVAVAAVERVLAAHREAPGPDGAPDYPVEPDDGMLDL